MLIKNSKENHLKKLKEVDEKIFQTKKELHQNAYEITKLRTHIARYQILLRKNNINEDNVCFRKFALF